MRTIRLLILRDLCLLIGLVLVSFYSYGQDLQQEKSFQKKDQLGKILDEDTFKQKINTGLVVINTCEGKTFYSNNNSEYFYNNVLYTKEEFGKVFNEMFPNCDPSQIISEISNFSNSNEYDAR